MNRTSIAVLVAVAAASAILSSAIPVLGKPPVIEAGTAAPVRY